LGLLNQDNFEIQFKIFIKRILEVRPLELLFKSGNLEFLLNTQIETEGFKSKNNENEPKQGLENSKWNLNLFKNQAFRF
jgi:hypothetical protein